MFQIAYDSRAGKFGLAWKPRGLPSSQTNDGSLVVFDVCLVPSKSKLLRQPCKTPTSFCLWIGKKPTRSPFLLKKLILSCSLTLSTTFWCSSPFCHPPHPGRHSHPCDIHHLCTLKHIGVIIILFYFPHTLYPQQRLPLLTWCCSFPR